MENFVSALCAWETWPCNIEGRLKEWAVEEQVKKVCVCVSEFSWLKQKNEWSQTLEKTIDVFWNELSI